MAVMILHTECSSHDSLWKHGPLLKFRVMGLTQVTVGDNQHPGTWTLPTLPRLSVHLSLPAPMALPFLPSLQFSRGIGQDPACWLEISELQGTHRL